MSFASAVDSIVEELHELQSYRKCREMPKNIESLRNKKERSSEKAEANGGGRMRGMSSQANLGRQRSLFLASRPMADRLHTLSFGSVLSHNLHFYVHPSPRKVNAGSWPYNICHVRGLTRGCDRAMQCSSSRGPSLQGTTFGSRGYTRCELQGSSLDILSRPMQKRRSRRCHHSRRVKHKNERSDQSPCSKITSLVFFFFVLVPLCLLFPSLCARFLISVYILPFSLPIPLPLLPIHICRQDSFFGIATFL